ncbi:energy transducer TonB [Pseudoalteromonas xiamenensis]
MIINSLKRIVPLFGLVATSCVVAQPATLIKNNNPKFVETSQTNRLEGFALMSYIIDTEGKVKDIDYLLTSDVKPFEEKAATQLQNFVYSPAIQNEDVVSSSRVYLVSENIGFVGYSNDSVSSGFYRRFANIYKNLQNTQFDLETKLTSLYEANTKNTAEQALYYFLEMNVAQTKNELSRYEEALFRTYTLKRFLPQEFQFPVSQAYIQQYMRAGDYLGALRVLRETKKNRKLNIKQDVVEKAYADILTQLENQPTTSRPYEFSRISTRLIGLAKRDVAFEVNAGTIEKAQLRCDYRVESVEANKSIHINDKDGVCQLLVKSYGSARITIKESGQTAPLFEI